MIRKFKADDIDRVMILWLETNIKAHNFIEDSYWQSNFHKVKDMMPSATIYVYEQNGVIQGFIGLMDSYIAGIFVDSEIQSKGIGKQLLNYVKDRFSELSLQVYKQNSRAVQFYLRENFTISDEQIDEDTDKVELLMNWRSNDQTL